MKRIIIKSIILLSLALTGSCAHSGIGFDPTPEFFQPPIDDSVMEWVAKRQQDDAYFRIVADLASDQAGLAYCERPKIPFYDEYENLVITAQANYGWFKMPNPAPVGYFKRDANAAVGDRCQFSGIKTFLTPWMRIEQAPYTTVAFSIERTAGSSLNTTNIQGITNTLTNLAISPETKLASDATIAIINQAIKTANIVIEESTKKDFKFDESVDLSVSGTKDLKTLGRKILFTTQQNNQDPGITIGTLTVYLEFTRSVLVNPDLNTGKELYAPKPDASTLTAARSYKVQMSPTNQQDLQSYFSIPTLSPTLTQIDALKIDTQSDQNLALQYCQNIKQRLTDSSAFPFNSWDRAIAYAALFNNNQEWRDGNPNMRNACTNDLLVRIATMGGLNVGPGIRDWPDMTRNLFQDFADSLTMAGADQRAASLGQFFAEGKSISFENYTTLLDSENAATVTSAARRLAKLQIAPNACVLRPSEGVPQDRSGRILFRALSNPKDGETAQPTSRIYEIDATLDFAYNGSIIRLQLRPAPKTVLNLASSESAKDPSCAALLKTSDASLAP